VAIVRFFWKLRLLASNGGACDGGSWQAAMRAA
jgi:hypothetical protein